MAKRKNAVFAENDTAEKVEAIQQETTEKSNTDTDTNANSNSTSLGIESIALEKLDQYISENEELKKKVDALQQKNDQYLLRINELAYQLTQKALTPQVQKPEVTIPTQKKKCNNIVNKATRQVNYNNMTYKNNGYSSWN